VGSRTIGEGEWKLRKAASLVKLLALEPRHQLHRERAMDLLWPSLNAEAAANNLYHVLHVARRVLGTTRAVCATCASGATCSPCARMGGCG
jgi:DNA-binding SARP family transcriptional activator